MKLFIFILFVLGLVSSAVSQTLFTYGKEAVSKEEFLRAFEKNNIASTGSSREKDIRNYLELYTRFKLKVKEAYAMQLDTIVGQQSDVLTFRKQIEEPYMTDNVELKRLTDEAFERSQKDIRLAHIFIPYRMEFISNPLAHLPLTSADSLLALKRANEAYEKIMKGEDFGNVAIAYSADPSAVSSKGDIGFITVFTLPYNLENVAYSLLPGKVSAPFRSSAGYHIFKNLEERPAIGTMKVSQILIAFDPNGSPANKAYAKKLADSLYGLLARGAAFNKMAVKYSYDKLTNVAGGLMPPVGVGMYEKTFEDAVFSLKKNGELSRPFETQNGFHIVKRLEYSPVLKNAKDAYSSIKSAVDKDKRSNLARKSFENKVKEITGMKKTNFNFSDLWKYTDSSIRKGALSTPTLNANSVLLEFPKEKFTISDWLRFASGSPLLTSAEKYPEAWEEFETGKAIEYYRRHLDEYSPEFSAQFKEFMEGNLLFEIMERKIWSVSSADTIGLKEYYTQHKASYVWPKSADAIIFNAADSMVAVKNKKLITGKPASWKKLVDASNGAALADSGRLEWSQVPARSEAIKAGLITPVLVNEDRTASFTYVIKVYLQPTPRSFNDARGIVMNDYQQEMESKWIGDLKKKYPVVVDQTVLRTMW